MPQGHDTLFCGRAPRAPKRCFILAYRVTRVVRAGSQTGYEKEEDEDEEEEDEEKEEEEEEEDDEDDEDDEEEEDGAEDGEEGGRARIPPSYSIVLNPLRGNEVPPCPPCAPLSEE